MTGESIVLKLMADYHSSPLWVVEPYIDNLALEDAPISDELRRELDGWVDEYDTRLNFDSPNESREVSDEEVLAFDRKGVALWRRLRRELPESFVVHFFSDRYGLVFTDESELPEEVR